MLAVDEAFRLVDLAQAAGIQNIVVAHPCRGRMTVDQQKQLASKGVWLEGAVSDWMFHRGLPRTNYYAEPELADEIAGIANAPEFSGIWPPWARQIRDIGIEHLHPRHRLRHPVGADTARRDAHPDQLTARPELHRRGNPRW